MPRFELEAGRYLSHQLNEISKIKLLHIKIIYNILYIGTLNIQTANILIHIKIKYRNHCKLIKQNWCDLTNVSIQ